MKPISFALIGKEVLFSKLDAQLVGYGVFIVIIGSAVSVFLLLLKTFQHFFSTAREKICLFFAAVI